MTKHQRASVRLLGISGSLRAASTNTRLLAAAVECVPAGSALEIVSPLRELPPFDPDALPEAHPAVARWVNDVREADGLVISTPEYARGYPGSLKNAFDWLVGTDAFVRKPFVLLNASARSTVAHETLSTVLETMSGVQIAGATIPLLGTALEIPEILANAEFRTRIGASLERLVAAVEALRA